MSTAYSAEEEYINNNLVERVDSGGTDESPFGSSLTTPVDEDVELFGGIEQRLLGKEQIHIVEACRTILDLGHHDDEHSVMSKSFPKAAVRLEENLASEAKLSVVEPTQQTESPSPTGDELFDAQQPVLSRPRSGSIYSQPNRPINIDNELETLVDQHATDGSFLTSLTRSSEDKSTVEHRIPSDQQTLSTVAQMNEETFSALPFSLDNAPLDEFSSELDSNLFALPLPKFTVRSVTLTVLRTLLFLPWCVSVGGAILLLPTRLELIAFGPGYIPTPRGIRRFSFWAESGLELVAIFLAFLASIWWIYPTLGLLALGGVVAQCIYAWQDFVVDRSVPLGEDDRQSLYLVAIVHGLGNTLMDIRKAGDGYLVSLLEKDGVGEDVSEDESDL